MICLVFIVNYGKETDEFIIAFLQEFCKMCRRAVFEEAVLWQRF